MRRLDRDFRQDDPPSHVVLRPRPTPPVEVFDWEQPVAPAVLYDWANEEEAS